VGKYKVAQWWEFTYSTINNSDNNNNNNNNDIIIIIITIMVMARSFDSELFGRIEHRMEEEEKAVMNSFRFWLDYGANG
jgi:hypothetical protein